MLVSALPLALPLPLALALALALTLTLALALTLTLTLTRCGGRYHDWRAVLRHVQPGRAVAGGAGEHTRGEVSPSPSTPRPYLPTLDLTSQP